MVLRLNCKELIEKIDGVSLLSLELAGGHHAQSDGIEHVLVKCLFPGPVLGKIDFEFRKLGNHDGSHLVFASPAMAANEFLHCAGGKAHYPESFSSADSFDFITENIEESRIPVSGEEGFFEHQHLGF